MFSVVYFLQGLKRMLKGVKKTKKNFKISIKDYIFVGFINL